LEFEFAFQNFVTQAANVLTERIKGTDTYAQQLIKIMHNFAYSVINESNSISTEAPPNRAFTCLFRGLHIETYAQTKAKRVNRERRVGD
jgi:hypothetical protein